MADAEYIKLSLHEDDDKDSEDDIEEDDDNVMESKQTVVDTLIGVFKFRLYFLLSSFRRSFLPFLSVMLRQRGLAPWQIGAIRSATHLPRCVCRGPVTFFADHFQVRKLILILSILSWIGGFGALVLVKPHALIRCMSGYTNIQNGSLTTSLCIGVKNDQLIINRTQENFPAANVAYNCSDLVGIPSQNGPSNSLDVLDWLYPSAELWKVFTLYVIVVTLAAILQGASNPLASAAVLDSLGKEKNNYGWQKAFGAIGKLFGYLLGGYILSIYEYTEDYCGISVTLTEFWGPYLVFASAMVGCVVIVICWFYPKQHKENLPRESIWFDFKRLVKSLYSVEISSYLMVATWYGLANSISTGFLFWHIATMGSSYLLMGIIGATSAISETVAYSVLPSVTRRCDYAPVTGVALALVGIRFLGYARISNPWWFILADCLKGLSSACIDNNVRIILSTRTPTELSSSVQSVFSTANSLGSILGNMIGGLMISAFGAPVTFAWIAVISFLVIVIFIFLIKVVNYVEVSR